MRFERALEFGKVAESLIARFMMARGHAVMPVYEVEKGRGKGPQIFAANAEFVAPDMLVFKSDGGQLFIEAKHKTVFSWHRKTRRWVTGIDLRHYEDYRHVARMTQLPVWLMFYHGCDRPDERDIRHGCPPRCPTGLFAGEIRHLAANENHRSPALDHSRDGLIGHGASGMVYWAVETLRRIASKDEVEQCAMKHAA